jgi:DNA-binding NtrC family response regulator
MDRILVVDDEKIIRFAFCEILTLNGFSPVEASTGIQAIEYFRKERPGAVLLDLKMPGMNGMDTLRELKKIDPAVPVIIITSHGDVSAAVEATKLGAYDFLLKPPDFEALIMKLKRALEKRDLERKVKELNEKIEVSIESSLGSSQAMRKVVEQIHQVAASDFSIIIQGETGTGKTFIANIIHTLSGRARGPFITVDLGAIPETLVESELFGHEKGAFTGAEKKRTGYFETAGGGTIFLDEIQNISPAIQGKMLRFVEERNIHPVGSTRPVSIDTRIIAATNGDIKSLVREKKFREDLYFRLCEFLICIPPLRERADDVILLARKFCFEAARELKKQPPSLTEEAEGVLRGHAWPGNVRELRNVVKRAVLLCDENVIMPEHISFFSPREEGSVTVSPAGEGRGLSLEEWEMVAIRQALDLAKGNKTKAAAILKIDYTTLLRKIKQYCISL